MFDTLESPYNDKTKKVLLALWTSCLKDIHTSFQINVGIVITYFEDFTQLYAENGAASTMN